MRLTTATAEQLSSGARYRIPQQVVVEGPPTQPDWLAKQSEETPAETADKPESEQTLPVQWAHDIAPQLQTIDFVENLLTLGGMSVLYGDSNAGKSFFALDIAYHVATGRNWYGAQVDVGGVIYIALEGTHGTQNRIYAMRHHHEELTRKIPLGLVTTSLNLCQSISDPMKLINTVQAKAKEIGSPVLLVIVDTLSRAMAGGNENAPEDMTAVVATVDRIREATKAHIMLIHHSGKVQAAGARGHSSLRAATDTEIELTVADKENKTSVAKVTKQRDLDGGGCYGLRLVPVSLGTNRRGSDVTSCYVEHCTAAAKSTRGDTEAKHCDQIRSAFVGGDPKFKTDVLEASSLNPTNFRVAWGAMLRRNEIVKCGQMKAGNNRNTDLYTLVRP
jgi:hypothetical protein